MNKMTPQEVYEALKAGVERVRDLAFEDFEVEGLGNYKVVSKTGGEDRGSDWTKVFHFPDHNTYIKVSGYYQSYSGCDFEDFDDAVSIVVPQEKVITVYQ